MNLFSNFPAKLRFFSTMSDSTKINVDLVISNLQVEMTKLSKFNTETTAALSVVNNRLGEVEKSLNTNVEAVQSLISTVKVISTQVPPLVKDNTTKIEALQRSNAELSKAFKALSGRIDREEEAARLAKALAEADDISSTFRIIDPCDKGHWGFVEGDIGTPVPVFVDKNGYGQVQQVMSYIVAILRKADDAFKADQNAGLFSIRPALRESTLFQMAVSGRAFLRNIWRDRVPQVRSKEEVRNPATNIKCCNSKVKRDLKGLFGLLIDAHRDGVTSSGRACPARVANGISRDIHFKANTRTVQTVSNAILSNPPQHQDGSRMEGPVKFLVTDPYVTKVNGRSALVPRIHIHSIQTDGARRITSLVYGHIGPVQTIPNWSPADKSVRTKTALVEVGAGTYNINLSATEILTKIRQAVELDDPLAAEKFKQWFDNLTPIMAKIDGEQALSDLEKTKKKTAKRLEKKQEKKRMRSAAWSGPEPANNGQAAGSPAAAAAKADAERTKTELVESLRQASAVSMEVGAQPREASGGPPPPPVTPRRAAGHEVSKPLFAAVVGGSSSPTKGWDTEGGQRSWHEEASVISSADMPDEDDELIVNSQATASSVNCDKTMSPLGKGRQNDSNKRRPDDAWDTRIQNLNNPRRKK